MFFQAIFINHVFIVWYQNRLSMIRDHDFKIVFIISKEIQAFSEWLWALKSIFKKMGMLKGFLTHCKRIYPVTTWEQSKVIRRHTDLSEDLYKTLGIIHRKYIKSSAELNLFTTIVKLFLQYKKELSLFIDILDTWNIIYSQPFKSIWKYIYSLLESISEKRTKT